MSDLPNGRPESQPNLAPPIVDALAHDIVENHDTASLERQLVIEVLRRSNVPDFREELTSIKDAYDLATELHADDTRADEPYINHLLKTATRGISRQQLGVADPYLVKALLLHDSVESHPNELADVGPDLPQEQSRALALEVIQNRFGAKTMQIILGLTTPLPSSDIRPFYSDIGHTDGLFKYGQLIARVGAIAEFTEDLVDLVGVGDKIRSKAYFYEVRRANSLLPIVRAALLQDIELPPNDEAQPYTLNKMPLDNIARAYVVKDLNVAEERIQVILADV